MSPDLDQFLVMAAVGAALGYFGMRFMRKKKAGQCSSGGCCSSSTQTFKPRKPGR